MVPVVQTPVVRHQPALRDYTIVERRARDGNQHQKLHCVNLVAQREVRRPLKDPHVVGVCAQREHAVHTDAVVVEGADASANVPHVLVLIVDGQRGRIDRLEAAVDHPTAGIAHQAEQLVVQFLAALVLVDHTGAHLCRPGGRQAALDHPAQERPGARFVHDEVVVVEEDRAAAAVGLQFGQHVLNRASTHPPAKHADDGTEVTGVGTPPLGHNRHVGHTLVTDDEAQVRGG